MPRNLHVWDKFITPAELGECLSQNGLANRETGALSPVANPQALRLARIGRKRACALIPAVNELEERLLRELAEGGYLTADELARRIHARTWVHLSTVLAHLVASGYVTVVGPLGRAETRYRVHPQGLAALGRAK